MNGLFTPKSPLKIILFLLIFPVHYSPGLALSMDDLHWRFWSVSDGLAESWSQQLSLGKNGTIRVVHGDVTHFSEIDGFNVNTVPRAPSFQPVLEGAPGHLWTIGGNKLYHYQENQWEEVSIAGLDLSERPFFVTGNNNILVVFEDRLLSIQTHSKTFIELKRAEDTNLGSFIDFIAISDDFFWLNAERGIAQFQLQNNSLLDWSEFSPPSKEFSNFRNIHPAVDGALYITADSNIRNGSSLFQFSNSQWREIHFVKDRPFVQGWQSADGKTWLHYSNFPLIQRLDNGDEIPFDSGVLSGVVRDVLMEPNGSFWLATSLGIARYTPLMWASVDLPTEVKKYPHALYQDEQNRLWIDCISSLVLFDQQDIKMFPYPAGIESDYYEDTTICPLPDGRLVIRTANTGTTIPVFDPVSETFGEIHHPEGLEFGFRKLARDGKIWSLAGTFDFTKNQLDYRIEKFDGKEFETVWLPENTEKLVHIRSIMEASDGKIWIGGTGGLGYLQNGEFQYATEKDGFTEDSGLYLKQLQDGVIWAGGRRSVLQFKDGVWSMVIDGLDQVRSIFQDGSGDVWVSSNSGLYRFTNGSWIQYTEEQGLPSRYVTTLFEDHAANLWVATTHGLCFYQPEVDSEPPNTYIPESLNAISYSHDSVVRILFNGADKWKQTPNDQLLYSYRLNNQEWSGFSKNNFSLFPSLIPGSYQLEVRVMDLNLNIDPTPEQFEFEVLLPWYKEPLLILLASIGAIIILSLMGLAIHHEIKRERLLLELQHALSNIKTLHGLLPICAHCKNIRNDDGYWEQIEGYVKKHSETEFTHGICPECIKKLYPEFAGKLDEMECYMKE